MSAWSWTCHYNVDTALTADFHYRPLFMFRKRNGEKKNAIHWRKGFACKGSTYLPDTKQRGGVSIVFTASIKKTLRSFGCECLSRSVMVRTMDFLEKEQPFYPVHNLKRWGKIRRGEIR